MKIKCPYCGSGLAHIEKKFRLKHVRECKQIHYHNVSGYGHYSECKLKSCKNV